MNTNHRDERAGEHPRAIDPQFTLNSLCNQRDAHKLADEIRYYWHSRGFTNVDVGVQAHRWHMPIPESKVNRYFTIVSNLVNGCPPNAKTAVARTTRMASGSIAIAA